MKKALTMILAGGVIALFGTACSNFETNRIGEQVDVKMAIQVEPEVEIQNQTAEGNAKVHCLFGIFKWGVNDEAIGVFDDCQDSFMKSAGTLARQGAAYSACKTANADMLIAPRYEVTTTDYFVYKLVDCKAKGYPAVLKSVKLKK